MEKNEDEIKYLQSMLLRSIKLNLGKKRYSFIKTACKLLIETTMDDWIFMGYGCRLHKQ
jgi:hypothetical protein